MQAQTVLVPWWRQHSPWAGPPGGFQLCLEVWEWWQLSRAGESSRDPRCVILRDFSSNQHQNYHLCFCYLLLNSPIRFPASWLQVFSSAICCSCLTLPLALGGVLHCLLTCFLPDLLESDFHREGFLGCLGRTALSHWRKLLCFDFGDISRRKTHSVGDQFVPHLACGFKSPLAAGLHRVFWRLSFCL